MDSILDFVRIRQLNIAIAVLLTVVYLVFQYWGVIIKRISGDEDEDDCRHSSRLSRSRSRSASRSRTRTGYNNYTKLVEKHRRGRKSYRRCPECDLCNFDD